MLSKMNRGLVQPRTHFRLHCAAAAKHCTNAANLLRSSRGNHGSHVKISTCTALAGGSGGESEFAPEPSAPNTQNDAEPDITAQSTPQAFDAAALNRAMSKLAAFESYTELLAVQNKQPSLLTAAVLIARHRYPDVNERDCSAAIDEIVEAVTKQLPPSPYPLKIVNTIVKVMYGSTESGGLGWTGNDTDYQSPNNSCINRVLETRSGIPITMSLVFMEVASRLGVPFVSVPLPGHFMCRPSLPDVEVLVDAFSGTVCTVQEAEETLSARMGSPYKIDPKLMDGTAMDPRAFLSRMLNNLRVFYLSNRGVDNALVIIRYMQVTVAGMEGEQMHESVRDEALCLYVLKRWHESMAVLRTYLELKPDALDAALIYLLIQRLKTLIESEQDQANGSVIVEPGVGEDEGV